MIVNAAQQRSVPRLASLSFVACGDCVAAHRQQVLAHVYIAD
jgi:hypothetical protein